MSLEVHQPLSGGINFSNFCQITIECLTLMQSTPATWSTVQGIYQLLVLCAFQSIHPRPGPTKLGQIAEVFQLFADANEQHRFGPVQHGQRPGI